ncbi:MAG: ParB/RepB/Spo0J family partition protein [Clostridia bacterium]|nr:ParB/RepB/Spo0J family partition protein [Clostridia bacterium]
MKKKTGGLGKGISALIPESSEKKVEIKPEGAINTLKLTQIEPNPDQPRKAFDDEKLAALADSVKEHGILQPIVVRKNENGLYTIIAGERRWRAARMAKLKEVPVIIKDFDEKTVMEVSLIENLQREDLNPIEEALGYERLLKEFGLTQEEIAAKVGKSRPAVANTMRILALSQPVRRLVEQLELSAGHGRALLGIEDAKLQEETAYIIIERDWSVRQTENYVNQLAKEKKEKPEEKPAKINIAKAELEERLGNLLGTKVTIKQGAKKGRIEIEFYDKDSLEKIVNKLGKD